MNKKLLLLLLLPFLAKSNDKLFDISINASTSYSYITTSEKSLKEAGFSSLVKGNHNKKTMLTSLALEGEYNLNKNLKIGFGTDVFFETTINPPKFSIEEVKEDENVLRLKEEIKKLDEDIILLDTKIDDLQISRDNATNKKIAKEEKKKELVTRENTIKKAENTIKEAKIKYGETDTLNIVDQKYTEYEQKADVLAREEEALKEEIKPLEERKIMLEFLTTINPDNQEAKAEFDQLKVSLAEKKQVIDAKHNEFVLALRDKQTVFNELLALRNEEKYKKEKEEIALEKVEVDKEIKYYEDKAAEYRRLMREERALKSEKEDEKLTKEEELSGLTVLDSRTDIEKENEQNYVRLYNSLSESKNYGSSLYGSIKLYDNITENLEAYLVSRLGIKVSNNPLNDIADDFSKEGLKIDGNIYVKPDTLKSHRLDPMLDAGLGFKYKGFKTEIFGGLNKGIVALRLGYEF